MSIHYFPNSKITVAQIWSTENMPDTFIQLTYCKEWWYFGSSLLYAISGPQAQPHQPRMNQINKLCHVFAKGGPHLIWDICAIIAILHVGHLVRPRRRPAEPHHGLKCPTSEFSMDSVHSLCKVMMCSKGKQWCNIFLCSSKNIVTVERCTDLWTQVIMNLKHSSTVWVPLHSTAWSGQPVNMPCCWGPVRPWFFKLSCNIYSFFYTGILSGLYWTKFIT